MIDLTLTQRKKLQDPRLNKDHLIPFFQKWIDVPAEQRPPHITDMLKRFAELTAKDQAKFYVNPLTDEIIVLDYRDSYKTYIKSPVDGWKASKYYS